MESVKINITLNQLGLFSVGEGEAFTDDAIKDSDKSTDFFIKTEYFNGKYLTYFIPHPTKVEAVKNNDFEGIESDLIDSFTHIALFITDEETVLKAINNNPNLGIYKIKEDVKTMNINNFHWFYLGFYGTEVNKKIPLTDKLYTEILKKISK